METKFRKFQLYISELSKTQLIIIGVLGLIIISGIGYYIWKKEGDSRQYRGATVEVEKVRKGSIERKIDAVGSLTANESVVIKPQVSGIIKEIHTKGGDLVKEGDPLITIDDRLFKAQLKEAEAKFVLAQINYDRKKKLFENSAGAKAKLDEAHSQLGVAEANMDLAKIKLKQSVIRAPFDGVAGIKMASLGDSVNEQKELLIFVDVDPMKIDFKVASNYVQLLSIGQTVNVYVDGFGDKEFPAEIEEIDSRIDPHTHSLALRAKIPNKNGLLKPGLFARVGLIAGSKDDTLLVPASAIEISGDEEYLYRVVERSGYKVAEKVTITTGIRNDETIEIVRGLKEGDIIVTAGQVKIQDGSIVRPIGEGGEEEADKKADSKEDLDSKENKDEDYTNKADKETSSEENESSKQKEDSPEEGDKETSLPEEKASSEEKAEKEESKDESAEKGASSPEEADTAPRKEESIEQTENVNDNKTSKSRFIEEEKSSKDSKDKAFKQDEASKDGSDSENKTTD